MIRVLLSTVACLTVLTGCNSSEEPKDEPSPKAGSKADTPKEPAEKAAKEEKNPAGPIQVFHDSWKEVPVDEAAGKGLKWLLSVQGDDGGWGQDGGRTADTRKGINLETSGNDVANTALVCLALLRSGHAPGEGEAGKALLKGIQFILGHVEKAPQKGLSVTNRKGTQIQRKLGPHIDTFLSTLVLSEVDGGMADAKAQGRVRAGLEKCIAKVETNQGKDGSWNSGGGWAPVIGTSIASRGLYVAQGKGVDVQPDVINRVNSYTASNFDSASAVFTASEGGAGVELYQAAQALEQSSRTAADRTANAPLIVAAEAKLTSATFVGGFGSMGGEEFVSYLNISDSLCRTGGKKWTEWNAKMKERLVKLQNQDGTWAGHHCITGRVACTSAAVMTLLAERAAPRVE